MSRMRVVLDPITTSQDRLMHVSTRRPLTRAEYHAFCEAGEDARVHGLWCPVGWLIDPLERRVWIYRPGEEVEGLDEPLTLIAGPLMPGFELDLQPIWNPQV